MKRLAVKALILSAALSASALVFASDWEEDAAPRTTQPGQGHGDTIILDAPSENTNKTHTTGGMLHGSATAVRTHRPPSYSALAAQNAARYAELQRLDLEANRFLQSATLNQVTPASVFRSFVEKNHPGFLLSAENDPEKLVLIKGQWDESSKPLRSLGLKFKSTKAKELDRISLDQCKVLVIDCAGEVPRGALQKIRNFVAQGGYLLSTDWTLQNVLERAFPEFIHWNRDNTEGVITDAFIVDQQSELLSGLEGRFFTWKLDRMSQCVRIVNPNKVRLLARSSKLARLDPQLRVLPDPLLAGGLALEFTLGRGKVLHLVGHFDNCSNSFRPLVLPDPAQGAGISLRQALAANFIVQGLKLKQAGHPQNPISDSISP